MTVSAPCIKGVISHKLGVCIKAPFTQHADEAVTAFKSSSGKLDTQIGMMLKVQ